MQDLKLIQLTEKDIPVITKLAAITWNQHYPSIIGQQQVDYMLELMYSEKSLAQQMNEKGDLFFAITVENEKIGFISVNEVKPSHWFLNKFYIDQTKAAAGLGSKAFEKLVETINPQSFTLTVNRKNFKSINFYFKNGFWISEVKDFDIGEGYVMEDFIMKWEKQ
ncbi:MAG: GNAT family N-acetyltransferase [Bacteroidia bacterium]